jgi:hypothetical protein
LSAVVLSVVYGTSWLPVVATSLSRGSGPRVNALAAAWAPGEIAM